MLCPTRNVSSLCFSSSQSSTRLQVPVQPRPVPVASRDARRVAHRLPCNARGQPRASWTLQAVTSNPEVLTAECRALEAERDTALSAAEACAKTATKLAEMARLLEQLALDKVRNGDELGAKQALQEKASVKEALDKNAAKADANYQLAAVLASKIAEKQAAVLAAIRSGAPAPPSYSAPVSAPSSMSEPAATSTSAPSQWPTSYSSGAGYVPSADSDTPKWKWQQSLEHAQERLRSKEAEAAREGRMARLSAEASLEQARQRIARQAHASVVEGLERLRASEANAPGSLEAAQARLRARDEEVLTYVRRVMARYRRGEYVSEDELEFAFQQLEKRFIA